MYILRTDRWPINQRPTSHFGKFRAAISRQQVVWSTSCLTSRVRFLRSEDRMALFPVGPNTRWRLVIVRICAAYWCNKDWLISTTFYHLQFRICNKFHSFLTVSSHQHANVPKMSVKYSSITYRYSLRCCSNKTHMDKTDTKHDRKYNHKCISHTAYNVLFTLLHYYITQAAENVDVCRAGLRLRGALGPNILRGPIYTHS